MKRKMKQMTRRNQGRSLEEIRERLNRVIIGWVNYYALADGRMHMACLDERLRRRMRQIAWKQWKTPTEPKREPKEKRSLRILGYSYRRDEFRNLASIEIAFSSSCLEQRILATVRNRKFPRTIPTSSYLTEPPDADPHVRWCGRGAHAPLSRLYARHGR